MNKNELIAGMSAGALSTLLLHPIDLIKVHFQVDRRIVNQPFLHTFKYMKQIYNIKGFSGIYRGLSANLIGATSSWGLYFMLYQYFRDQPWTHNSYFGSAAIAGMATQLVTNPLWVAKSKLCSPYYETQYSGLLDCLYKVSKNEGIRGIYRGLVPGLFGVSHGAVQFSVYERMKLWLIPWFGEQSLALYIVASSISKIAATAITYPYQVIRTRVQINNTRLFQEARLLLSKEGIRGIYKGLSPSILRVLPATCITFATYENVKIVLNK